LRRARQTASRRNFRQRSYAFRKSCQAGSPDCSSGNIPFALSSRLTYGRQRSIRGATLNGAGNPPDADFENLSSLQAFSRLSTSELRLLTDALALADFKRPEVILREAALASEAHILLKGIARITCRNARRERVTIALLRPGPILEFPSLPLSRFDFRCEAYHDCRVGSLNWNDFNRMTAHSSDSTFKKFHENDLQQWYRLLLRGSGFLNLGLHERIAITLLELCSDFGVKESRGTLLSPSFSHQDIAELVGASRPRVTEHLSELEREHLVIRQGRQLIVRVDKIGNAIGVPPVAAW
jgi:CRP/FNR family transcriptional regulator, cyclic AMP receptor protein